MKVLVQGKLPDPPKFIGTCKNCKCLIECEEHELSMSCTILCPTDRCSNMIQMYKRQGRFWDIISGRIDHNGMMSDGFDTGNGK